MPHQHNGLGIAYRVMAMACMACLSAVVKWTGQRGVPVFEIILFRNLFAFLPLGLYIWRTTGFSVLKTRRPLGHLTRSAIGIFGMTCGFSAVQYLPLTSATAFNFASPLFMTALSALILHEPVGRHRWGAVIVGFVGVLIMVHPQPGHMNVTGGRAGHGQRRRRRGGPWWRSARSPPRRRARPSSSISPPPARPWGWWARPSTG